MFEVGRSKTPPLAEAVGMGDQKFDGQAVNLSKVYNPSVPMIVRNSRRREHVECLDPPFTALL